MIYYRDKYVDLMEDICEVIKNKDEYDENYLKENCDSYFYSELIKNNIPKKSYPCPNSEEYCEIFHTLDMGRGIRAKKSILKNTKIGCYIGVLKHKNDIKKEDEWRYNYQYAINNYIVDDSNNHSIMSIMNHSSNPNVTIFFHLHRVNNLDECHIVCITTRDIEINEELFIDYGEEYWIGYNKIYNLKNQPLITNFFQKNK